MGILRFIVWTALCIGVGIFAASYRVGGRTPVEHAERGFQKAAPAVSQVREGAEDLVDGVRKKVAPPAAPVERHSESDRDAVNKLIARGHGH